MCGKYSLEQVQVLVLLGSPPHVREVVSFFKYDKVAIRITPACAGSTCVFYLFFKFYQDHPRMCGKYEPSTSRCQTMIGSPPHVREVLIKNMKGRKNERITPACAGSTLQLYLDQLMYQDHPRMCGKYLLELVAVLAKIGSPPHVREVLITIFFER